MESPGEITALLARLASGDKAAEAELMPHVYSELKRVAAGYLLNLKRNNGLDTLNANQRVPLQEGMEFFSQAPGGASS